MNLGNRPTVISSSSSDQPIGRPTRRHRPTGQVVVIFAGAMFLFLLLMALVIDLSWYWVNTLKVQRAADAAALAGVVWLPNDPTNAYLKAKTESTKNGYTDLSSGVVVTPLQDSVNDRRLNVTISAPVDTFFMRILGISSLNATEVAHAEFVLPVPMGSPENYYGVFGTVRDATFTAPSTTSKDTGWQEAGSRPTGNWNQPDRADNNNDNSFAVSQSASGSAQQWSNFGFSFTGTVVSIDGIEVRMRALTTGSNSPTTNCQLIAAVSRDNGTTWAPTTQAQILTTTETLYTLGSPSSNWGQSWTTGQMSNFRLRLTWNKVICGNNRTAAVDTLEVRATYTSTSTTTTTTSNPLSGPGAPCVNGKPNCFQGVGGQVLNARGFWGTMNSEGSDNVNGDAHQPYYDTATGTPAQKCPSPGNACYDMAETSVTGGNFYNYAIEMQPNTTGGYVYIYDPGFCNEDPAKGTGDHWFSGSHGISAYYTLWGINGTPYDLTDDGNLAGTIGTPIAASGTTFENIAASDTTMNPNNNTGAECKQQSTPYGDGRDYHDSWYLLNPGAPLTGGPNGTIYRLHTSGTKTGNLAAQQNADGAQSFAIYATDAQAPITYPKVYGMGAMQMYTPLSASGSSTSSEFYLAQVPAWDAGKTIEIQLWDPGDTSPLTASLAVEQPSTTVGTWTPIDFLYHAHTGTTNANRNNACNTNTSGNTPVGSVQTSVGNNLGLFNGCWLTIDVQIPVGYTAPQSGWWKIKYTMNGTGTSSDVTTWSAIILGNPVHLVLP